MQLYQTFSAAQHPQGGDHRRHGGDIELAIRKPAAAKVPAA